MFIRRWIWCKKITPEDAQHLIKALRGTYKVTMNVSGTKLCGLNFKWDYTQGYVDVYMENYVIILPDKLNHPLPKMLQYLPH